MDFWAYVRSEPKAYYVLGYYLPSVVLVLVVLLALLDVRPFPKILPKMVALSVVVFLTKSAFYLAIDYDHPADFTVFWSAGQDVLAGRNPYDNIFIINPPTAVPLYWLLGCLPLVASHVSFSIVNLVLLLTLVPISHRLLVALRGDPGLNPTLLAGLTMAVALSHAAHYAVRIGQLPILVAAAILVAILAEARRKPLLAGVMFALGTVKIGTLFPFLAFPLRCRSWRALATSATAVTLLAVAIPGPARLPHWLKANWQNVMALYQPGRINDIVGSRTEYSIISLDRAYYHLGILDRSVLGPLHLVSVAAIGVWIAFRIFGRKRWSRGFAVSMLAVYATIFLYHRTYDLVVLALPATYAAIQAHEQRGSSRTLFAVALIVMLSLVYVNPHILSRVLSWMQGIGPAGRFGARVLQIYASVMVVATMALMTAANERALRRPAPTGGADTVLDPPQNQESNRGRTLFLMSAGGGPQNLGARKREARGLSEFA